MAELRSIDPRTLHLNPNNPRRTAAPPAMDDQLVASIKAVGIIQPPCVTPKDGGLMIVVGNRRVKAAIAAGLPKSPSWSATPTRRPTPCARLPRT